MLCTATGVVDKNRDALFAHAHDALAASQNALVRALFPKDEAGAKGDATVRMTVANKFLTQLGALTATLRSAETRFVRCVKTNEQFAPQQVDYSNTAYGKDHWKLSCFMQYTNGVAAGGRGLTSLRYVLAVPAGHAQTAKV